MAGHRRRTRIRVAALAASVVVAGGCAGPERIDATDQPSSAAASQFFRSPGSPWTAPLADDAPVDPRSAEYVAMFEDLDPVVSVRKFSVPVYLADATSPVYVVRATAEYTVPGYEMAVRIPERAAPDPEEDGHMAVLDETTGCVVEFFQARRDGDGWTADWLNSTPAEGDGIYPDGLSSRAAGFSAAAGLIWPDELRDGRIKHALVFAYPFTLDDDFVGTATRTDGRTEGGAALPIGAHLRLDPSIDIDALGLPSAERTIAAALQEFGMILADTSAGFTLYTTHPQSFAADPYPPLLGNVDYATLARLPFDRMQVLSLGDAKQRYTGPPITNRCNETSLG